MLVARKGRIRTAEQRNVGGRGGSDTHGALRSDYGSGKNFLDANISVRREVFVLYASRTNI